MPTPRVYIARMNLWINLFLESLARTGIVSQACRDADISNTQAYTLRKKDGDFAAAWDEAMEQAVDVAEAEVWRRGVHGYDEPLTHQGRISWKGEEYRDDEGCIRWRRVHDADGNPIPETVKKHSDALLALLVKGRRKKVFADRTELTGADGGDLKIQDSSARAARVAQLIAFAQARKAAEAEDTPDADDFSDIA